MDREKLRQVMVALSRESPTNILQPPITEEEARRQLQENDPGGFRRNNYFGKADFDPMIYNKGKEEKYIGLRFFGEPVFSVGSADDPGFPVLRNENVVGPYHLMPKDLVPEARSVISIFLPYSDRVLESNRADPLQPSMEWMFTRVDGQNHLLATGLAVAEALREEGWNAVVPQTDDRYVLKMRPSASQNGAPTLTSNWSERHVAYVSGLGTFGLSTCLITRAGSAGRLISVVTDWPCEPDVKDYRGYLDYCSKCGACLKRCPAAAIRGDCSKDIAKCSEYVRKVSAPHSPRYGCGKCQSAIPCERRAMA